MRRSTIRLVVDTNTLLRGLAKRECPSGQIITAIEERQVLLRTSKRVVEEYRLILLDPLLLARFPTLTPRSVEGALRGLTYLSHDLGRLRTRFEFLRDRKDEKFLALAIAGRATHLLTFDQDLLSLENSHNEAAKRLRQRVPGLRIQEPSDFVHEH